jgi:isopentenyl-diphosphate delta-isomerase
LVKSKEQLICVDIFDREIGQCTKLAAHQKGILHRAFSVFLIDPKGQRMLLQQRAGNKYHSGGLWANTCCSHPRPGEETQQAAQRRLLEETGIECSIQELFSFIYRQTYADGLSEYECDHVFLGFYDGDQQDWRPDAAEIQAMAWFDLEQLAEALRETPEQFAAWFIIAAPQVLQHLKVSEDNAQG